MSKPYVENGTLVMENMRRLSKGKSTYRSNTALHMRDAITGQIGQGTTRLTVTFCKILNSERWHWLMRDLRQVSKGTHAYYPVQSVDIMAKLDEIVEARANGREVKEVEEVEGSKEEVEGAEGGEGAEESKEEVEGVEESKEKVEGADGTDGSEGAAEAAAVPPGPPAERKRPAPDQLPARQCPAARHVLSDRTMVHMRACARVETHGCAEVGIRGCAAIHVYSSASVYVDGVLRAGVAREASAAGGQATALFDESRCRAEMCARVDVEGCARVDVQACARVDIRMCAIVFVNGRIIHGQPPE